MPTIRWDEHSAYLADSVSELYRNSEFTDCILEVEGWSIQVHKTILAACSPYFKKLLKNHHAISFIPIKDVKYQDLKLILDFIYYGEIDVHIQNVASLIKTAEVMEMTSLKQGFSRCFGEDFFCNNTSIRSLEDRCSLSCTKLTRNDTKNLLEEQITHDSTVLRMREERLDSKSQNIHLHSVGDSTTKHLIDFPDVSEKLNKDQPKGSIPNTCDSFRKITKQDEENVNDELIPLTFVAVPPVSEINEHIEEHQDNRCFDSVLMDPLGEYSGNVNVAKERNIKEECTFQSELQVKNEPKEENDVSESMTEVVLIADKLTCLCHELKSTDSNPFVSCDQESAMESNPDVILSDTLCSEGCAAKERHAIEIKFESICEISGADVKEEKVFETGQCLNHCVGNGTGTPPVRPESELLKSGAEHFSTIDYQQDVNEEEHDATTNKIGSPFHLESGNKTPDIHRLALSQIQLCEERRGLMERTESISSHIPSLNTEEESHHQQIVPRDSFHMDPSELRCEHGLTRKVQIYSTKRKNYSCIRCRKSFIHKHHFEAHILIHAVDKPFQCEVCKKSFTQKIHLKFHLRTHSGEKPYQCEICKKSFKHKNNLKTHERTHFGEKLFQCEICQKSFTRKEHLTTHKRSHSGEKPYKCEICEKSFKRKEILTIHKRSHTGETPFQCEICKKSFNRKDILTNHKRTHTGEKPFQCEICQKSFSNKAYLKIHLRQHTGENPFQCDICKKSFKDKRILNRHLRTHTGEKPFQCEICQISFNRKQQLTRHKSSHTVEKKFQCEMCQKSFNRKQHLTTHKRSHTVERQFQCEMCQKSFNRRQLLTEHKRTHTWLKPS